MRSSDVDPDAIRLAATTHDGRQVNDHIYVSVRVQAVQLLRIREITFDSRDAFHWGRFPRQADHLVLVRQRCGQGTSDETAGAGDENRAHDGSHLEGPF